MVRLAGTPAEIGKTLGAMNKRLIAHDLAVDYLRKAAGQKISEQILIAPDGFFHRGLQDFLKGQPKIGEVEKEVRAQIEKCRGTGLRFIYLDWHMASNGGKERPEIEELFRRLCREYGLLYSHDAQDFDGRYSGAKFFPAGLEAWGRQVLPDGRVAYWCGPDLPEATRLKFLDSLKSLQPGTWYTLCHPGLYARRQAQSVAVICSQEVKTSSARAAFD